MTAILAIDFHYQIVVIADCRVSWSPEVYDPQDNLQKVYPLGPTGIFGFSGSVPAARSVANAIKTRFAGKPLPPSAANILSYIATCARDAYARLPATERGPLQLMYVAPDYGGVTLAASNVTFARNIMVKMEHPTFTPVAQEDAVRLGYAKKYPMDVLRLNRNNLLNLGLEPLGHAFQIGVCIGAFAPSLAAFAPKKVGGLFTIGVATARGVSWYPYGPADGYEMAIEQGHFVQIDHNTDRRVTLQTIFDFDPRNPAAGNLMFETPKT